MSPRALLLALLAGVVLAAGAVAAAGQTAPSGPAIARSSEGVAGRTVIAWTAPFAQYQLERARRSDCQRGQRAKVFFVPAATGPNQTTSCTVPAGLPVMVVASGFVCTAPLRGFCTDTARINDVRRVRFAIDGAPVTIRQFDWVSRQAFRIAGEQAAVAAYAYIISGLAPGEHTITTSATERVPLEPPSRVGMTATITVR